MAVQDGEVLQSEHAASGIAVVELLHLWVGISENTASKLEIWFLGVSENTAQLGRDTVPCQEITIHATVNCVHGVGIKF